MDSGKTRNNTIDIMKGIAIILMVGGHCAFPGTHFIYLFHMAIFIMASGYFFQTKYSDGIKQIWTFIKRRLKGLWLPYVLCNIVFSLLHNFFIKVNIYTNNTGIYKYVSREYVKIVEPWSLMDTIKNIAQSIFLYKWTGNYLLGAFWFIETLFKISILFCLIDFIIKKVFKKNNTAIVQMIISIIFLIIGFCSYIKSFDFYGTMFNRVFSYYILFFLGYCIKKYNISEIITKNKIKYVSFCISLIVLCLLNQIGTINLTENYYTNPGFLIIASIAGWVFIYVISYCINNYKIGKQVFAFFGQSTLFVLTLHYLCFKIVSYIGIMIDGKPSYCIAAFPILYDNHFWWIPYMIVGLIIPICICIIWNKIKPRSKMTLAS